MKRAVVVLALLSAPVLATALRDFAGMRGDANMGWNTANGSPSGPSAPSPTFDLVAGQTTPNDLSDSLTVNSTSMTLVLACDAQGISGTNWTCRGNATTLAETGTGSSPTTTINTPFHAHDSAERDVVFPTASGGKYYQHGSPVANLGTDDDLVVEVVRKVTYGNTRAWLAEKDSALATAPGWYLFTQTSGGALVLSVSDGTNQANAVSGNISTFEARFAHVLGYFDASDTGTTAGQCGGFFFNGTATSAACSAAPSTVGSPSTSSAFTVDANSLGGDRSSSANRAITSFRIWKCSGCLPGGANNPTEMGTIARQRTATAFGIAPTIAAGTAAPTALTRATTANVDVVDGSVRHLYQFMNGAPRVARRTHSGGTVVAGYLSEPAVSNLALQSQTLGTTWTAITAGDNVLADAFAGADLTTTGDDIDGNNSSGEHGLRQGITVTAATHSFSVWAKAGAQSFVALRNATIANGTAWFDVSTCTSGSCTVGEDCAAAVGTVQAGVIQARAQRYPIDTTGDGVADVNLCRVGISYTGTAASHNHDLLCAPSNGNLTYTDGDTTADCGFWGVRVEAYPTMTSYLATTTAAVARNADDVRFDGASHYTGSPSTMDVAVLCPNFAASVPNAAALTVGVNSNSGAFLRFSDTQFEGGAFVSPTTEWAIISTADTTNGVAHTMRQTMATNNITAYYDGVSVGVDTSANLPPSSGAFVWLGSNGAASSTQPGCLISRARLWSSLVAP